MRVIVCAIARNEHLYINDWIAHYLSIGVDKIYIYDNDTLDSPYLKDIIKTQFLKKVEIIDMRGVEKKYFQQWCYNDFYLSNKFDWCLFCDIDEFLFGVSNIKLWLETPYFRKTNQIRVKWKLFGDDDLIKRDMNEPVWKCFKNEIKTSLMRDLSKKGDLEKQGKFILRGGLKNVNICSPHFASYFIRKNVIPSLLPSGKPCYSQIAINEDYSKETVFLHHYMTKSLSEFVTQKLKRNDAVFNQKITLDYFWRINKKTQEKINWLKNMGLEI